jgi:hypothetical protein
VVGTVVVTACVAVIVIAAIVPTDVSLVAESIVPPVMASLMLALLVVGRIIATAAGLSDRRDRDGAGQGERRQSLCASGIHVGSS